MGWLHRHVKLCFLDLLNAAAYYFGPMSDEPFAKHQNSRDSILECIHENQLRILVTGFEPFGGAARNPSGQVALGLDGQTVRGGVIIGRILPVVWDKAPRLLEKWLDEIRPHVVIALGMARDSIEIELQATNRRHPERRDNVHALPIPPRAVATKRHQTALPADKILESLLADGTAHLSEDAGGFLCEEVFFALQSARAKVLESQQWPLLRSGFVHVPNDRHVADEQALALLQKRVVRIVEVTIDDLAAMDEG